MEVPQENMTKAEGSSRKEEEAAGAEDVFMDPPNYEDIYGSTHNDFPSTFERSDTSTLNENNATLKSSNKKAKLYKVAAVLCEHIANKQCERCRLGGDENCTHFTVKKFIATEALNKINQKRDAL